MMLWDNVDHNAEEQIERIAEAIGSNDKIVSFEAVLRDPDGNDFKTSFEKCSCSDFKKRKLPCKHMYSLAFFLGLLEKLKVEKNLTRKDMGIPAGTVFHIEYKGSDGKVSERDIEIQKITLKNDKLYLYAYCHISHSVKTFLANNILSMSYEGRQIKNLRKILEIEYPSPGDLVAKLAAEALEPS
ncbi:MAG: SWIM zinc finger family protein [Treponema sp.]|jgi:hypothetical protein|nr:SWIM zinc finger family protein [Treponema sp.]